MRDPGDEIGGCRIVEKLGEGGMGEVYRATQRELKRDVALKLLRSEETRGVALLRFERETRIQTRLSHPHLVKVYGAGEDQGLRYMILELVEGLSLRGILKLGQKFSWKSASAGMIQVLEALEYLEAEGIVHRDLKPANILVDRQGTFKVADFGLARAEGGTVLTAANQVLGTVKYLAPEMVRGGEASHPADVYAAGLVFYEMLAGRLPYEGQDQKDWLRAILQDPLIPLRDLRHEVTEAQAEFVMRLIDRDPGRRPAAGEARRLLAGSPEEPPRKLVPARRTGPPSVRTVGTPVTTARWNPRLLAGATIAIAVFAATVSVIRVTPAARAPSPPIAGTPPPAAFRTRLQLDWVQAIPATLPAGLPVIPWWEGTLHRDGKALGAEEWRAVFEHNRSLEDGERPDVWLAQAVFHGRGLGMARDLVKAQHLLKKAARSGHGMAMIAHGFDSRIAPGPEGEIRTRAEHHIYLERWLERAADEGAGSAMFELGVLCRLLDRPAEGMSWWQKAAAAGNGAACVALGKHLVDSAKSPEDHVQAREWFRKGAAAGDPAAWVALARLINAGQGGPRDQGAALELFTRAANLGDPWGALGAGEILTSLGRKPEADSWFERGVACLGPKTFDDLPRHSMLLEIFEGLGHKAKGRPADDVQLLRGSLGL